MLFWRNLRIPFLAFSFSGVMMVLGKSILYPAVSSSVVAPFAFPTTVALPGWQSLPSHPLRDINAQYPNYLSGRQYQYIQDELNLEIEMRYLVNSVGDIDELPNSHKYNSLSPQLRQKKGIGFYEVFTDREKAYLRSCINPYGGSTVNDKQFKQNRNTYDLQSNRLIPWLLGIKKLKDERCLWAYLSIPLKRSSHEAAYQHLENVWVSWYGWWQPRFPKS